MSPALLIINDILAGSSNQSLLIGLTVGARPKHLLLSVRVVTLTTLEQIFRRFQRLGQHRRNQGLSTTLQVQNLVKIPV